MRRTFTSAFLLTLGLLLAGELLVRTYFARSMSGRFDYGYSPTAGFDDREDGTVRLVRSGGRRFHPQKFSRERPPGIFRIIVVGDSVPRGPSLEASYASQLGRILAATGVPCESWNLAVPGYGAHRDSIVLSKALEYQPSLVILHANNSNEYEDEREFKRKNEFQSWHPDNWLLKSLGIRRLYEAKTEQLFWKWLPPEIRIRQARNDADAEILASLDEKKLREWDERVRRFTTASINLARQKGVPVLLITQARFEPGKTGVGRLNDGGLDALAQSLCTNGVFCLSMKQTFDRLGDPASFFADGAHLRREGHAVLADAIVKKLRQENLVR